MNFFFFFFKNEIKGVVKKKEDLFSDSGEGLVGERRSMRKRRSELFIVLASEEGGLEGRTRKTPETTTRPSVKDGIDSLLHVDERS